MLVLISYLAAFIIDLVTVFDAILTSRQLKLNV